MPKVTKNAKSRQTRMDFFLASSPTKKQVSTSSSSSSNGLRQATIQSLTRVVSIDHLIRCKTILSDEKTEKVVMVSTLEELGEKIPSREVIKSTKIGYTIRKLLKHKDEDIAEAAKYIYEKWKNFFIDQSTKTAIDVKCSTSTENCRRNARRHLAKTLGVEEDHPRIAQFEKEAFHLCKTKTLHQYKRILRCIILKSKTDTKLREMVMDSKTKTSEIVQMFD